MKNKIYSVLVFLILCISVYLLMFFVQTSNDDISSLDKEVEKEFFETKKNILTLINGVDIFDGV